MPPRLATRTRLEAARVDGNPEHFVQAIHEAVPSVDPLQPVMEIRTMEQVVSRSIGQRRLGMLLFVSFGAIALLLASAGIYGARGVHRPGASRHADRSGDCAAG